MKRLLILPILFLAACATRTDTPSGVDTSAATTSALEPQVPATAEALVGQWRHNDGRMVEFRGDGTYQTAGAASDSMFWRVLDNVLLVSDSSITDIDAVAGENRYQMQRLTGDSLVLIPQERPLGGTYTRQQ